MTTTSNNYRVAGPETFNGHDSPEMLSGPESDEIMLCFARLPKAMQTTEADVLRTVVAEDAASLERAGVSHEAIAQTLGELFSYTLGRLEAGDCQRMTQTDRRIETAGTLIDLGSRLHVLRSHGKEKGGDAYWLAVTVVGEGEQKGVHTITDLRDGNRISLHPAQVPLIGMRGFYGANADRDSPHDIARLLEIGHNRSDVPDDDPVRKVLAANAKGERCSAVITDVEQFRRMRAVADFLLPGQAGYIEVMTDDKVVQSAMKRIYPNVRFTQPRKER